ncbi:hypothetical protein BC938DRAFT_483668 [Jimgerdemannia flammicorona]|uniref:Cardiolipin synthase N-terminal domain-containing protein n=1 Tax=Jimgerdemannia flammicorona TaxID=994334 RepID=A0A433QBF7_9FUNG|nr:hypothetical protein BC938DRAFT_483668 [Jimgerdemannia flammicorona]
MPHDIRSWRNCDGAWPLHRSGCRTHKSFPHPRTSHALNFPLHTSFSRAMSDPLHYSGGLIGLIILIIDLIVIFEVLNSTRSVTGKLLWSLLVFFFPVGGVIIYFLFSNRSEFNIAYTPLP